MTRNERIRQSFTKPMSLIEIGPSYNPILPKSEGWNTTIIDHADRAELVVKYHEQATDNIEDVDIIWRDGRLLDTIPARLHGTFDGLIASHSLEHMPDLIGFFQAAAKLLKPSGTLVLALPDKRLCFDFFQPLTTTGHAIDGRDRTRHSRGTLFDHAAYLALRGNTGSWHAGGTDEVTLAHSLETVSNLLTTDLGTAYHDAHTWRFTPASFQLLTLELNLLRLIPWAIARIEPTDVIEFYVWLERRELPWLDVETQRLRLLRETVMETREQVVQLDPPHATPPTPSISAIVPLYNGAKHIEQSLRSILAQTLPPCEIIVVDDGSTDAGPDLVKAMAAHHPITLLTKPNGGQSSARNFGVAHSHGTLIALLDQDDMWYPRHLEELIKPFLAPPLGAEIGWVYSDLDEVDENGLMVTRTFLKERSLGTHPKRSLIDCLKENMFVLPSASLISRKAFDAVGGFDEQLSGFEDDDLFLRLFRAGYDNIFFDVPLSKWRIFNESYSYTYRMRRSRAIYVKKLLQEYPDDPRRSRYYKRHLILPRFYPDALVEFRDALMADDPDRIAETRADLMFLVNQMPSAKQRILGRVLGMVRSPQSAKMAFAARPYLRPLYRRFF